MQVHKAGLFLAILLQPPPFNSNPCMLKILLMKFFDALFQVIDVKAGGGKEITMGEMVKQFLTKLEWFDTRWPRIPVPVQKEIDDCMEQIQKYMIGYDDVAEAGGQYDKKSDYNDRHSHSRDRDASGRDRKEKSRRSRSRDHDGRDRNRRDRDRDYHHKDRDKKDRKDRSHRSRSRDRGYDRHKDSEKSRSRDNRDHDRHRDDYQYELKKYSEHRKKEKKHKRSRSRSRSR